MEEWRDVVGYEGCYQVSSEGHVKSVKQPGSEHHNVMLKPDVCMLGKRVTGLRVTLCKNGKTKRFQVHAIVLEAFVGNRPYGYDICHCDGNASNNQVTNLRYDTHINNEKDKVQHGTLRYGRRHPRCSRLYTFISPEGIIHEPESVGKFFQAIFPQYEEACLYAKRLTDIQRLVSGKRTRLTCRGWKLLSWREFEPSHSEN